MTTDTFGGVFTYALELCAWLTHRGVRVTLASMGADPSPAARLAVQNAGAELVSSSYRLEWMEEPWKDVHRAGEWLLEVERCVRPDIVHVNGYTHAALPFRAPVLSVAHSCILSWWRAVFGTNAPERYREYHDHVRRGLTRARVVVAPTRVMLGCLRREYGRLPHGRVIYNGIAGRVVASESKESCVVAAGRLWDRAKNIRCLLEAAPKISWPVFVAGDTQSPDGESAPELTGLQSLGALSRAELGALFQRSSIFALPALYEPFGLCVLEAAQAGAALVLGDIPSMRELWQGRALFANPTQPESVAKAVERLIAEPQLRQELSEAARRQARRLSNARMGRQYLALYRMLGSKRAAAARAELGA
jgi:glycosyltransferase involved in cell wall biosynthesis